MNEIKGKSVGAIVRRDGKFLTLYRLKIPQGLAFPAGHIEPGEEPEEALIREFDEEVGLKIVNRNLVYHGEFQNPCPKNHSSHEWWVYEVETEGEPSLKEPDKHKFLKFMSLEEMRSYIERGECDPAWFTYILPALKIT